MGRKKVIRDPIEEIEANCKLLCDEAANHMKARNYYRALSVYQKVRKSTFKKLIRFKTIDISLIFIEMFRSTDEY